MLYVAITATTVSAIVMRHEQSSSAARRALVVWKGARAYNRLVSMPCIAHQNTHYKRHAPSSHLRCCYRRILTPPRMSYGLSQYYAPPASQGATESQTKRAPLMWWFACVFGSWARPRLRRPHLPGRHSAAAPAKSWAEPHRSARPCGHRCAVSLRVTQTMPMNGLDGQLSPHSGSVNQQRELCALLRERFSFPERTIFSMSWSYSVGSAPSKQAKVGDTYA